MDLFSLTVYPSSFLFPYHVLGKSCSTNLPKALMLYLPPSAEVSTGSQAVASGNTIIILISEYSVLIVRF